MRTFGIQEENKSYLNRVAAYGIILNASENKVAIVRNEKNDYFLPGGGLENGETLEACMKREAIEETGREVKIEKFLGSARNYFYSEIEKTYYLNEGHFYICKFKEKVCEPLEDDYFVVWEDIHEAIRKLIFDHHSWAVQEAIK